MAYPIVRKPASFARVVEENSERKCVNEGLRPEDRKLYRQIRYILRANLPTVSTLHLIIEEVYRTTKETLAIKRGGAR